MRPAAHWSAIQGVPATLDQIHDFFTRSGWRRFSLAGDTAYFDPERNVVISDTHRGNIILMKDGLLAPHRPPRPAAAGRTAGCRHQIMWRLT